MINRTHPSDLARFRHTDFGYFAGGGTSGQGLGSGPVSRNAQKAKSGFPDSLVGSEWLTGPASIQFKQGRGGGRW